MDITYKSSGVDIDAANTAKKKIANELNQHNSENRVLNKVGAFASLYDFSKLNIENPVLVLKTEEPGSKQKLALKHGKVESICYDMINHLTNDIIVMGAKPLTVQDAIICGKLDAHVVGNLVKHIAAACRENGSVLTGGETSEQPGVIDEGIYILTSSIVGVVDRNSIIDGSAISCGDSVLALASNGIHTNGYSFLRRMIEMDPALEKKTIEKETFIDIILRPHQSYFTATKDVLGHKALIGMSHITGGGIAGNLNRILPPTLNAKIDLSQIQILPIFQFIKKHSNCNDAELLKTFNMGVGMAIVVKKGFEKHFIKHFKSHNINCYSIGEIVEGNGDVNFVNELIYG